MASAVKIEVRFFASLKEELGVEVIELHLTDSSTRTSLLEKLERELGCERVAFLRRDGISIAVNQSIEQGEFTVCAGDEIAFLPPITGG